MLVAFAITVLVVAGMYGIARMLGRVPRSEADPPFCKLGDHEPPACRLEYAVSITNRIASWVLDRLIELVPEPLKSENEKLEDPPPVWRYTIRGPQGDAYLTRVLFPRIPWLEWRPMVHKFHRPDVEDALHNHPWKWCASLILAGGYVEERMLPDESQLLGRPWVESRLVRWFNWITDQDFHKVVELRGATYTLFVTGERTQSWGFKPLDGEPGDLVERRTSGINTATPA